MSDSPRANSPPRMPRRGRKGDDPRMIGPWKIGRTIGKGCSGRVKIARHSKTGKYAAIKIVSKIQLVNSRRSLHNMDDAERILLSLEREIVIMKLIDHPNIMHLHDVWETSGELYLVLEYVEGGELFDYICECGRLPADEALNYFQQLIGAMDYCHRFNIAHRDLKPENLLLDKDKNLKVADFGMAAWQGGADDLLETACGSPHYAAPEVVSGAPYDGTSSDIWSCGVILFALLVGRLPFDDENLNVLLEKVKSGKFTMPSDIDGGAQDLINKMLEKDVKKRIKMSDILKHPWYISQPTRSTHCPAPSLKELAKPVVSASDIDADILGNLRTLWHGSPDEDIVKGLLNDEQTWEKVVYHLLLKYRSTRLENYDDELERAKSQRKSERRQKSAKAEIAEKPPKHKRGCERPETPVSPPPRPDPPTPRRAGKHQGKPSTPTPSAATPSGPSPLPPPPAQNTLRHVTRFSHPASALSTPLTPGASLLSPPTTSPASLLAAPGSPIWEALDVSPPLDVPELHDAHVQRFFQQIVDHLNAMQSRPGVLSPAIGAGTPNPFTRQGPAVGNSRAPPPTPVGEQAPYNIRTPQIERSGVPQTDAYGLGISTNNKENENHKGVAKKKSSLRKPKDKDGNRRPALADRHVQIVLPPPVERDSTLQRRLSCDSHSSHSPTFSLSEGSSTFAVPSGAKRSWFTNLFKFKPAAYTLLSVHNAVTTRDECRRLLTGLGVRVAALSDTHDETLTLKCVLDEVRDPAGVMAVAKAVRFHVDVRTLTGRQAAEAGVSAALDIVLEKGALSSFRLIHQRLRKEWDLDIMQVEDLSTNYAAYPSPLPVEVSSAERFIEDLKYD